MFFRVKETNSSLSKAHLAFLNEADREYMKAFNTKSTRFLQKYLSRDCGVKMAKRVYGIGTRYFGSEKFRNTLWNVQSTNGDFMVIEKKVTFDKVKVAGSICIGVADDYTEIWTLDTKQMLVTDIQVVKEIV